MANIASSQTGAISDASLKALIAICCKAGRSGMALQPDGGWPAYALMPSASFWRGVREIDLHVLAHRSGDGRETAFLLAEPDEGTPKVKIACGALALKPGAMRTYVGLATFADYRQPGRHGGRSKAHTSTIARRLGMTERAFLKRLAAVRSAGFYHRKQVAPGKCSMSWSIKTDAPKGEGWRNDVSAWISHEILAGYFGFDFSKCVKLDRGSASNWTGGSPKLDRGSASNWTGQSPESDTHTSSLPIP